MIYSNHGKSLRDLRLTYIWKQLIELTISRNVSHHVGISEPNDGGPNNLFKSFNHKNDLALIITCARNWCVLFIIIGGWENFAHDLASVVIGKAIVNQLIGKTTVND